MKTRSVIPARKSGAQGVVTHLIIGVDAEQCLAYMKQEGYEFMPDMEWHYNGFHDSRLIVINLTGESS